jgi:hypothetical protein
MIAFEMRLAILLGAATALVLTACGSNSTKTVTKVTTTTTTATSAPPVLFQGVAGAGTERPSRLELTGDGTLFVSGVQWSSWGGAQATGNGNAEYHGCTPTCAQATPQTALVAIRLSRIRVCSGQRYYSAVTLTMNSGQPLDRQFLERSWSPC